MLLGNEAGHQQARTLEMTPERLVSELVHKHGLTVSKKRILTSMLGIVRPAIKLMQKC